MTTDFDTTPEDIRLITPWRDPIVEQHGYPATDEYVEIFWLPIVGPTGTLILRRLVKMLNGADYIDVEMHRLAAMMGLSYTQGERSPFGRALGRLCMFSLARPTRDGWDVRTHVPTVPMRQQSRWPAELVRAHNLELEQRAARIS